MSPKRVCEFTGRLPHIDCKDGDRYVASTSAVAALFPELGPRCIYPDLEWPASIPTPETMNHLCRVEKGLVNAGGRVFDENGYLIRQASHKWRSKAKGHTRVASWLSHYSVPRTVASLAVLTSSTQHYYFHWLFDVLPRLQLLETAGLNFDAVLVDQQHGFQRASFAVAAPKQELLEAGSVPLQSAAELLVPCHQIGPGREVPLWVIEFLRDRFLPATPAHGVRDLPKRIYITRRKTAHRRVSNEEALLALLERHGIREVVLEDLDFLDQVALFAAAEIVVAPHGSGLANLAFCSPGTPVVELQPACMNDLYFRVSTATSLNYSFVRAPEGDPKRFSLDDYGIDPSDLERALDLVLGNDSGWLSTGPAQVRPGA